VTVSLTFGAAIGVILGFYRFKVLILAPAILLVMIGAVVNGFMTGLGPRAFAFGILAAVVALQIGYLFGFAAVGILRPWTNDRTPILLHAMQRAIGQELKAAFELPQELPPEIVAILSQMNERLPYGDARESRHVAAFSS